MKPPAAPRRKVVLPARNAYAVEDDVLKLIQGFVRTIRPHFVVESGAGEGTVTWAIWQELLKLGAGRLVSVESDPEYAKLLAGDSLFDVRCGVLGMDYIPEEPIEFAFLDSRYEFRAQEIETVWDFVTPGGIVLVHDCNRRKRDLWEPLLSRDDVRVVFIPTDRGLAVCEKL